MRRRAGELLMVLLVWWIPATFGAGLSGDREARVRDALSRGTAYLLKAREDDGSWMHHPALTALACAAIVTSGTEETPETAAAVDAALDFIVRFAKPDGSIWAEGEGQYPNYSTAVSLVALAAADRPEDRAVIRAARDFLMGENTQFTSVDKEDPAYGGMGYGKLERPDLSNTQWALEALHYTDHLDREPFSDDPERAPKTDLAWERALAFLTRCQNLPDTNGAAWVMSDPENRGGFIYFPGSTDKGLPPESKAGEATVDGKTGLRSYGSMTYAGLKSMIYAKLNPDDVRVRAAVEWVSRHYTFDENPGVGPEGHFYYLHTAAKALHALDRDEITDADGRARRWRDDLADVLLGLQREDGSWINEASGRWMENLPPLVTAYAMLALEVTAATE